MAMQFFTSLLHVLWCYIFVVLLEFEIQGLSIAAAITNILNLSISSIYAYTLKDIREAWFLPDRTCLYGIMDYMKIAGPSYIMQFTEALPFEIASIMTNYISVEAVAAHSIIFNIDFTIYNLAVGL